MVQNSDLFLIFIFVLEGFLYGILCDIPRKSGSAPHHQEHGYFCIKTCDYDSQEEKQAIKFQVKCCHQMDYKSGQVLRLH